LTEPARMSLERGLIQVYTGEGKGKTTAALGLALRASGHGLRSCIVQFMKGWPDYGELEALKHQPNVEIMRFGRQQFVDPESPSEEDVHQAEQALEAAREALTGGRCDIVILDEINVALGFKLISLEDVLGLMEAKPPKVELVMTGRRAHPQVVRRADLVTEMVNVKHPFANGIEGRPGIEY